MSVSLNDLGMTDTHALLEAQKILGKTAKVEYDRKQSTLKCWIYDISERGFIRNMWCGRTWEDALSEMKKAKAA